MFEVAFCASLAALSLARSFSRPEHKMGQRKKMFTVQSSIWPLSEAPTLSGPLWAPPKRAPRRSLAPLCTEAQHWAQHIQWAAHSAPMGFQWATLQTALHQSQCVVRVGELVARSLENLLHLLCSLAAVKNKNKTRQKENKNKIGIKTPPTLLFITPAH